MLTDAKRIEHRTVHPQRKRDEARLGTRLGARRSGPRRGPPKREPFGPEPKGVSNDGRQRLGGG
jgi:hypothetical protein